MECSIYVRPEKIPAFWSEQFADLISSCLEKDQNQRRTTAELLEHPFFQGAEECENSYRDDFCRIMTSNLDDDL